MWKVPSRASSFIRVAVGPVFAGRLIKDLEKWVEHSGRSWTCNRLKSALAVAIQLRAGNLQTAREILMDNGIGWTSIDPKNLRIKGTLGVLIRNFVVALRPQSIRRAHAMLRLHTLLVLEEVTECQKDELLSVISSETSGDRAFIDQLAQELEVFVRKNLFSIDTTEWDNPDLSQLKAFRSTHNSLDWHELQLEEDCLIREEISMRVPKDKQLVRLKKKRYSQVVAGLLTNVWLPPALQGLNPAESFRQSLVNSGAENCTAGRISFILENGGKVRVVAIPNVWLQWLLKPLDKALYACIRKDPVSVNFDQVDGAYFLQNCFEEGKGVASVDLSSATDRFPLALQLGFLRGVGLHDYADAIKSISEGEWVVSGRNNIHYGTGQPMGMYGSFPLFHLTHVWLLKFLFEKWGYGNCLVDKLPFRVLGDDVIISSPALALRYKRVLKRLGVEVSKSKTVTSSTIGQFAGFTGVKTPSRTIVYRPYKWKKNCDVTNASYGFGNVVKRLSQKWRRSYDILAMTWHLRYPDLSPFVPETEQAGKPDSGLDPYFLGSLVNEISDHLHFSLNDEFHKHWYPSRYILLGQKYVRDPRRGFDSIGSEPIIHAGYRIKAGTPYTVSDKKTEIDEHEAALRHPSVRQAQSSVTRQDHSVSNMSLF